MYYTIQHRPFALGLSKGLTGSIFEAEPVHGSTSSPRTGMLSFEKEYRKKLHALRFLNRFTPSKWQSGYDMYSKEKTAEKIRKPGLTRPGFLCP
jgi:hypothetical protein